MMALSVRQPWAWFILEGEPLKDYENRDWDVSYARAQLKVCPPGSNFLIHASAGMTEQEYIEGCEFAYEAGVRRFPDFEQLKRGGIVGVAKHEGLVRGSASKWFTGPLAIKLSEPYPLPFRALKGRLGFFPVDDLAAGQDLAVGHNALTPTLSPGEREEKKVWA